NSAYSSVDGVLFNKSQTTLIQYPWGRAGSYTIPNGITSIYQEPFYGCTSITGITIGNAVGSIGDFAFAYCTSLASVTIGSGVTNIGASAFRDCTSLTSI